MLHTKRHPMATWLSPDCRDGKHTACIGDAWDSELDQLTECGCSHHGTRPVTHCAITQEHDPHEWHKRPVWYADLDYYWCDGASRAAADA